MAIRRILKGETLCSPEDLFVVDASVAHGHVEAVLGTIRRLGLDTLIASKPCRERDLIVALVAERLLHPASKLATLRLWSTTSLAEELGVQDATVGEIYQALDWLLAVTRFQVDQVCGPSSIRSLTPFRNGFGRQSGRRSTAST